MAIYSGPDFTRTFSSYSAPYLRFVRLLCLRLFLNKLNLFLKFYIYTIQNKILTIQCMSLMLINMLKCPIKIIITIKYVNYLRFSTPRKHKTNRNI